MRSSHFSFKELFFFLNTFFQSSFRFTAKLRGSYRDFPYTPCPTRMHGLPLISISHQSGAFVTTDEPALIQHNHPESIVHLRVGVVRSVGFGKCVVTCIHLYGVSIFIALKILCALPTYPFPSPTQTLATTDRFTVSIALPFPEGYRVGII